jgi:hypothetical protein
MRLLTFNCAISSTMTSFIDLQGQHVPLLQAGIVWSGSLPVYVTDTLNIAYTVTGITSSPWSVDITMDCPGAEPAKIFSRKGTIPQGGSEGHKTSAPVPADPCAPKMEPARAEVGMATAKKASSSKKTKATKKN